MLPPSEAMPQIIPHKDGLIVSVVHITITSAGLARLPEAPVRPALYQGAWTRRLWEVIENVPFATCQHAVQTHHVKAAFTRPNT